MGRYDSHKHPFQYRMNQWASKRTNDSQETQAKSIPCHVTKVDKDFITVAFETANSIFTPPTVKIPQSMSQFQREPTQVGDKGYGVPGNYYLGGVTGDSGGKTDFYPRGNLTTLSFQPVSRTQNTKRDYDQHHQTGGPNGWTTIPYTKPKDQDKQAQDQQQQQAATTMRLSMRPSVFLLEQNKARKRLGIGQFNFAGISTFDFSGASTSGTSSSDSQQNQEQEPDDKYTQISFDKDKKMLIQSKDEDNNMVVDGENGKAHLQSKKTAHVKSEKVYIGDAPDKAKFARIMTEDGPSKNSYAKIG